MEKNGLKRAPQGPVHIKEELLTYKENVETDTLFNLDEIKLKGLLDTEKDAIVKIRIGQGGFRDKLIKKDRKCRVCGIDDERFLVASHIKP